jgi:hypothetical protein
MSNLQNALNDVEALIEHHVVQNGLKGRDESRSKTLLLARRIKEYLEVEIDLERRGKSHIFDPYLSTR